MDPSVPPHVLVFVPVVLLLTVVGVNTSTGVPTIPSPFTPFGTLAAAAGLSVPVPTAET